MSNLQLFLKNEWARLNQIKSGDGLPFWFLRITQALTILGFASAVFTMSFLFSFSDIQGFHGFSLLYSGLIYCILKVVGAEIGIRLLRKGSLLGWWFGLGVSLLSFSYFQTWILGVGGLYAMLNPKSQQTYLTNPPEWLSELLTLLKINYTVTRN